MENRNSLVSEQINTSGDDVTTWALPKGAITRFGHGLVQDMAFSVDGHYLRWRGQNLALWETMHTEIRLSPNLISEYGRVFIRWKDIDC